tara:strand:+ start:2654 stop:3010 length:357 start_codon:yes stop_codon:yes gene_type:complete
MKRDDRSPEAYIQSVGEDQQPLLLAVRHLILELEPDIDEHIEYGMLAFGDLANLAAQKNHISLYVAPKAMARFKAEYPGTNCGKSCLRLTSMKHFDPESIRLLLGWVQDLPPEERDCS